MRNTNKGIIGYEVTNFYYLSFQVTLRLTLERAGELGAGSSRVVTPDITINFYYLSFQVTLRLTLERAGDQHWRQG